MTEPFSLGEKNVVLIGPPGTGKSTLVTLLEPLLGRPFVNHGDIAGTRYRPHYDFGSAGEEARHRAFQSGEGFFEGVTDPRERQRMIIDMFGETQPYRTWTIERFLEDYPRNHLLEIGGTQPAVRDPSLRDRLKAALAGSAVVLILPSSDVELSIRVVRERLTARTHFSPFERMKYATITEFVLRESLYDGLASIVVHTWGKSPEQSRDEIMRRLQIQAAPRKKR